MEVIPGPHFLLQANPAACLAPIVALISLITKSGTGPPSEGARPVQLTLSAYLNEISLDSSIVISSAQGFSIEEVQDFYETVGYSVPVLPQDKIVVARKNGEIIGAVRVCHENDLLVLRGMQVSSAYQGQGLGSEMLVEINKHIADCECWCLPYAHLENFYSKFGFNKARPENAPQFLQDRLKIYQERGMDNILMGRVGV